MEVLQQLDFMVLDWIQTWLTSPLMDWVMLFLSALSNGGAIWIVAAVVLVLWKKHRQDGLTLGLALGMDVVLCNILLKNLFHRTRPFDLNPAVTLLVSPPHGYSFPSGHTAVSFAAATVLYAVDRRWGAAAYTLAALTGFSRLYLYVHFPTDVLAGALLGAAIGWAAVWFAAALDRKATKQAR